MAEPQLLIYQSLEITERSFSFRCHVFSPLTLLLRHQSHSELVTGELKVGVNGGFALMHRKRSIFPF